LNCMKEIKKNTLDFESEYHYVAKDQGCKKVTGHAKVSGVNKVTSGSSKALKAAIALGPVSVTVNASSTAFKMYKTGILNSGCETGLNHAITAVGWGIDDGQEYYTVRNSWGATWGDAGYIKIATQEGGLGVCGIQQVSVWPMMDEAFHA
jgi:C1A family cysteine protease